ncbi:MAG: hypothetical protein ABSF27_09685 [Candidatus Dormibacteria bacterium]
MGLEITPIMAGQASEYLAPIADRPIDVGLVGIVEQAEAGPVTNAPCYAEDTQTVTTYGQHPGVDRYRRFRVGIVHLGLPGEPTYVRLLLLSHPTPRDNLLLTND